MKEPLEEFLEQPSKLSYYDYINHADQESINEEFAKENSDNGPFADNNSGDDKEDFQFEIHPLKVY